MVAIPTTLRFTPEQFEAICAANRDLRLELTAKGGLIEMPPTRGETGHRNSELNLQLAL
jgi:Uma2 family endonuclease